MKNLPFTCLTFVVLFVSCSQEQQPVHKYFDFDGLLGTQISQLSQRQPALDKAADVSGNKSDSTFRPSAKGWAQELEIFQQLEAVNKRTHQNEYKVQDPVQDTRSNLKIRKYIAVRAPIPMLKVYYQNEFERLRKIEADITESNLLYTNSRTLVMEFEEENGKPLLVRYSINGFQKMILSDSVHFSVKCQIDW